MIINKSLADQLEELLTYPNITLHSIVANGSARYEFRVEAAEILAGRDSRWAKHVDLVPFLKGFDRKHTQKHPISTELDPILTEVEPENRPQIWASVTTKSNQNPQTSAENTSETPEKSPKPRKPRSSSADKRTG